MKIDNIMTFDIEDNFTYEELCNKNDWDVYKNQVLINTKKILEILYKHNSTATFFVLGKVAERYPEIVRLIISSGHEIASHGYIHKRVEVLGETNFEDDIRKSKRILEDIAGREVRGFRAMDFSINKDTLWALNILKENGYQYDSSILSSYYSEISNHISGEKINKIIEIPIPSIKVGSSHITFSGGIFFRIAPISLIIKIFNNNNKKIYQNMVYAHSWEFNKDQPTRNVRFKQRVAQSPCTFTTENKLEKLFNTFRFISIDRYLGERN